MSVPEDWISQKLISSFRLNPRRLPNPIFIDQGGLPGRVIKESASLFTHTVSSAFWTTSKDRSKSSSLVSVLKISWKAIPGKKDLDSTEKILEDTTPAWLSIGDKTNTSRRWWKTSQQEDLKATFWGFSKIKEWLAQEFHCWRTATAIQKARPSWDSPAGRCSKIVWHWTGATMEATTSTSPRSREIDCMRSNSFICIIQKETSQWEF